MVDQETFPCQICRGQKTKNDLIPAELVPASIVDIITKEYPAWSSEGYICQKLILTGSGYSMFGMK